MKRYSFIYCICMTCFLTASCCIHAQQLPSSLFQQMGTNPANPAAPLDTRVNRIHLLVQQRTSQGSGFRSMSQFVNYRGKPHGKKGAFRMGINIENDIEHTEHRFSLCGTAAVKVWQRAHAEVNLGFQAGLLIWNSNYARTPVYDPEDPLAAPRLNLAEVNSGIGASFRHRTPSLWFDLAGSLSQLTGNLISSPLEGIRLYPGLQSEAMALFATGENLRVGPRIGYQCLVSPDAEMGPGGLALGLRAVVPDRNFWVGGNIRPQGIVASLGFGFPLLPFENKVDTAYQNQLNLSFGASYPAGIKGAFGPTIELGLAWTFGRVARSEDASLPYAKPFWIDEPTMVTHKQNYLDRAGPKGLDALAEIYPKNVFLSYQWLDQSLLFCGEDPRIGTPGLRRVGMEWVGVDALASGMIDHVVMDALFPDSSAVRDPENLESLRHLAWIEVSSGLRVDAYAAGFGSDMIYQGQFSPSEHADVPLEIAIVYDEKDTVIQIPYNQHLSNLELATLKVYAIASRLEYELNRKFGEQYNILREEEVKAQNWNPETLIDNWRVPIIVRTPRITTNHANLQAFQINKITLKFPRRPENYRSPDIIWTPKEIPSEADPEELEEN